MLRTQTGSDSDHMRRPVRAYSRRPVTHTLTEHNVNQLRGRCSESTETNGIRLPAQAVRLDRAAHRIRP